MVRNEGSTSKRISYWWCRLGAKELISIRKEVLVVSVGSEETDTFETIDTSGVGWERGNHYLSGRRY
jgi:hypothetical protein